MQYVAPAVRPSVTLSQAGRQPKLWPVVGSLLLLSLSYLLLTTAPAVSQQLRALAGEGRGGVLGTWALALAATGLLLGGGAALVLVLVQLAADARRRPYVYLAPALAAFSACILIGLNAKLPLASVSAEHLAVFALVVSVVGGALMQDARRALQTTGLLLTLWPALSLLLMVWAATGAGDPAAGLWKLQPAARGYLVVLTISSLAIAGAALIVRSVEGGQVPAARTGSDAIGAQDLAMYAAHARARLTTLWTRDIPRLQRPLMVLCAVVLAVGVVRAIVGASSGREELVPARMEPVQGPTVTPWVPRVGSAERTPAVAPTEPAPQVSERALTNATTHARAHEEPRPSRERGTRASRHRRARADKSKPRPTAPASTSAPASTTADAPAKVALPAFAEDEWNQPIAAPKKALTPAPAPTPAHAVTTPTMRAAPAPTRAAPMPNEAPKPAPKPAAAESRDPGLDALMTDVLRAVN